MKVMNFLMWRRRDNSEHIDPNHKRYRNPVTMATDLRRKESKNVLEQLWRNSAKVACVDGEVRIHFSLGYLQEKAHMQTIQEGLLKLTWKRNRTDHIKPLEWLEELSIALFSTQWPTIELIAHTKMHHPPHYQEVQRRSTSGNPIVGLHRLQEWAFEGLAGTTVDGGCMGASSGIQHHV